MRGLLAVVLCMALVVIGGWAMLPEASADPRAAFAALREAAEAHRLIITGVEPAPRRRLPASVAWHPRRLLRSLQVRQPSQLAPPGEGASRYTLSDTDDGVEIVCEMQQREGAVVWVWLEGPLAEARRVKAIRAALRSALPWVPVSCPWK